MIERIVRSFQFIQMSTQLAPPLASLVRPHLSLTGVRCLVFLWGVMFEAMILVVVAEVVITAPTVLAIVEEQQDGSSLSLCSIW